VITKRIQRRNANILKYHEKGYDTRTIGRIFHLSHAQCANIIKKLKEQEKAELMDLEQRKNKEKGGISVEGDIIGTSTATMKKLLKLRIMGRERSTLSPEN